jgi:hypothetical protein
MNTEGKIESLNRPFFQFSELKIDWLPISVLINEALYIIDEREAHLGVWCASTSTFHVVRPDFSPPGKSGNKKWIQTGLRLTEKEHWDLVEPHGTHGSARPLLFVEQAPLIAKDDLFTYLLDANIRIPNAAAKDILQKI